VVCSGGSAHGPCPPTRPQPRAQHWEPRAPPRSITTACTTAYCSPRPSTRPATRAATMLPRHPRLATTPLHATRPGVERRAQTSSSTWPPARPRRQARPPAWAASPPSRLPPNSLNVSARVLRETNPSPEHARRAAHAFPEL